MNQVGHVEQWSCQAARDSVPWLDDQVSSSGGGGGGGDGQTGLAVCLGRLTAAGGNKGALRNAEKTCFLGACSRDASERYLRYLRYLRVENKGVGFFKIQAGSATQVTLVVMEPVGFY